MATTMFKPPPGPAISRPQPTTAIGQPMPPMQTIPEPVDGIGRWTGIKHFALGDGGAPEAVHVTPTQPWVPGMPTGDAPGEHPYADGGTFMVGPSIASSTTDPTGQQATQTGGATSGNGYTNNDWMNPASYQNNPAYSQPQFGAPSAGGSAPAVDPNQALYNARQRSIDAQRNVNTLQGQAQGAPQQRVYQTQGQVNQATAAQNDANRTYLGEQQAADQQRLNEIRGINAAHNNGPDIARAAEAEGAYAAEDRQDSKLGVAPPTTVQLPNGTQAVAGVRPKIMTQESYLTDKAQQQDADVNARLKIAQNVVSLMGTNVAAARQAAAEAGLSLQEANDMVAAARTQASNAGLDVQEQQLGQEGRVLYTDPYTGEGSYVTQAEADQKKAEYDRQRALRQPGDVLYTDPNTGERSYMSQAEADQRKADYQDEVATGRIPQQYQQQQRRTQYATQQGGEGAALAGLSEAQVLNTIPAGPTGGGLAVQYQVYQELVRRALQRGLSQEQASQAAEALIEQELASRRGAQVGGYQPPPGQGFGGQ